MESSSLSSDWMEYFCKSGELLFYYNKVTSEHRWPDICNTIINGTAIYGRPLLCTGTQTEDFGCINGCLSMYSCVNSKNDNATSDTDNDSTCTRAVQPVNMIMENKFPEDPSQPKIKISPSPYHHPSIDGDVTCKISHDATTQPEDADGNLTCDIHVDNSIHGNQMCDSIQDNSVQGNKIQESIILDNSIAINGANVPAATCLALNLEGSIQGNIINGDTINEDGYHGTSTLKQGEAGFNTDKHEAVPPHAISSHDDKKTYPLEEVVYITTVQSHSIHNLPFNIKEETTMDPNSNDGSLISHTESSTKDSLIEMQDQNVSIDDVGISVNECAVHEDKGNVSEKGIESSAEKDIRENNDEELTVRDYEDKLEGICSAKARRDSISEAHIVLEEDADLLNVDENTKELQIIEEGPTFSPNVVEERLIPCQLCDSYLNTSQNYHEHLKEHCCETSTQCPICKKGFGRKSSLFIHLQVHSRARGHLRSHKCLECNKTFISRARLQDHSSVHTGVNHNCCETCGKSFRYRNQLSQHSLLHTNIQCKVCKKRFNLKKDLNKHEKIKCTPCSQPFQCKICLKSFTLQSTLIAHARFHSSTRPFKCDLCEKRFLTKRYLLIHQRIHSGERPYDCKKCGKTFRFHSNFLTHKCKCKYKPASRTNQSTQPKKKHECKYKSVEDKYKCDSRANQSTPPKKTHECLECGKKFDFECNLKLHERVQHDFLTPYKCNTCGVTFKYKRYLTRHTCK